MSTATSMSRPGSPAGTSRGIRGWITVSGIHPRVGRPMTASSGQRTDGGDQAQDEGAANRDAPEEDEDPVALPDRDQAGAVPVLEVTAKGTARRQANRASLQTCPWPRPRLH